MSGQRIYADYNAQAPLRIEARAAIERALGLAGNASSVHAEGRRGKALLDDAREAIAAAVGASPADLIFTSGATEANNLALFGATKAIPAGAIFLSALEHDSIWLAAAATGLPIETIPIATDGRADLIWLDDRLARLQGAVTPLVCMMLANNETGIVQDVARAADLAHAHAGYLLCDAVQGLGRVRIDIEALGADYMSLSAHKIGGMPGCGALLVRGDSPLAATLHGGGQERSRRAGTENVIGAAAFGAACVAALDEKEASFVRGVRDAFEDAIREKSPGVRIVGADVERVLNTSCIVAVGVAAETMVVGMDLAGVACSAGAACSSGKVQPSRTLAAMGMSDADARSAVRFSFGWANRVSDGVAVAEKCTAMLRRAREQQAA